MMTAGKWFRVAAAAAVSAMVMVCGIFTADASASSVDLDQKGSISVSMKAGGDLNIFKVADVVSDNGYSYELTEEFSGIENASTVTETINDQKKLETSNAELAKTMAKYVSDKQVKYLTSLKATEESVLKFSDLEVGLYLITQSTASTGYSIMNPFLISIPRKDKDSEKVLYNLNVKPKNDGIQKETTPPPKDNTPPSGGKLPQTGQLWWPVAVLLAAGVILLGVGVFRRRSGN